MTERPPQPPPDDGGGPGARLPAQATMGLLEYVSAHALDADYAHAAPRRRRRFGAGGAAAIAAFALLLVVAATRTSQGAAADAEQREQLAAQVSALRDRVGQERALVRELEAETSRLQAAQLDSDASTAGLLQRVQRLGGTTGLRAVTGPGVQVVADDAAGSDSDRTRVLDSDLQRLANGFWAAGAEAIAVNGQRLTAMSAIRVAGSAITVNNRSLRAPYRLSVVGDPDTLPARFAETASGQAWLDLQRQVGLRLTITPADSLRLPAASPTLRFAEPAPADAGTPREEESP